MKKANLWIIALFAIITIAFIGCKDDPSEQPQKQPDTPRTLSFGTGCKVTIKSDEKFLTAEWVTLCDSCVSAIERVYSIANGMQSSIETYFNNNNVSVVLLLTADYDVETKSSVPKTIYFKANASVIDGITAENLRPVLFALMGSGSNHYPN